MHISSSYAKIFGQQLFQTREFPRSGSKAKDGEKRKRERERERAKVGDNNGQVVGLKHEIHPTHCPPDLIRNIAHPTKFGTLPTRQD